MKAIVLAIILAFVMMLTSAFPAEAHKGHAHAVMQTIPENEAHGSVKSDSNLNVDDHLERPQSFPSRLVAWLGAWHPAVVHFPIALTLTAALLELIAFFKGKSLYSAGNKILLALATVGAFIAAPLGWADMGLPTTHDVLTQTTHRWLGTAIPFLLVLTWYLKRPTRSAASYSVLLAAMVVVILFQAYLGGEITHGANHMAF